ncbi:MAG: aminoglycoside phosphotransferase family protein [Chlamydiota bacterium]|jgi:streptomycin 6-kinase
MKQFEKNIVKNFGKKGETWLENLPSLIETLKTLWNLSHLIPVSNMSFHYVALGMQNTASIVLKIGVDHELTAKEAYVLQVCNGKGYVRLLEYSKKFNALLLERIQPGTSLKASLKPLSEVMDIYGQVEKTIDIPFSKASSFPMVADWLTALDKVKYPEQYHPIYTRALKLRKKLLAETKQPTLLHGDLHLDNILLNGNEWVCIDPKGVIGDRGFEIAAFDVFSKEELPVATRDEFHKRLKELAEKTSYPLARLIDWFFLRLNLSAAWGIGASLDPELALGLAGLL